jgi:hypothetical protein
MATQCLGRRTKASSTPLVQGPVTKAGGYDPRPVLMSRWEAGDGRRWAELAYDSDAGQNASLLAASLARVTDSDFAAYASEAAGIIEARPNKLAAEALVAGGRSSGQGPDWPSQFRISLRLCFLWGELALVSSPLSRA